MECFFIHNEWNDICILNEKNIISRKNIENERGYFYYEDEYLIIKWDMWNDRNKFKKKNNIYIDVNIFEDVKILEIKFDNMIDTYFMINDIDIVKNNNRGVYKIKKKLINIIWDNDEDEIIFNNNNNYFELNYFLNQQNLHLDNKDNDKNNNKDNNKDKNTNNARNEYNFLKDKVSNIDLIDNDDDNEYFNIDDNELFYLIDGFFYNKVYLENNKLNKNKTYCMNLDIKYNKNENFFFNLFKFNKNYLDIENYINCRDKFIINENDILNKFFYFDSNYNLKINKIKKKILTLSEWGYPPFGGGENWLLNLSKIYSDLNFEVFLICFSDGFTGNKFNKLNIIDLNYVKIIQMPFDLVEILKLVKIIKPSIINHQGIKRIEFMKIANVLQIPFITGFCFWNNIIKQVHSNINILENKNLEKDETFDIVINNSYVYCASEFVNDVIHKFFNKRIEVIETITLKDDYYVDVRNNKYVTLLNCHYSKGGFLIKYLLENLNIKIPLLLVHTECDDKINLDEVRELMNIRNKKNNINILYEKKQNVIDIYKVTRIMLVPSICDETFCRVAYEARMNNIPIITTKCGNLKYLLKNYARFLDQDIQLWKKEIELLYPRCNNIKPKKNNFIEIYEKNIKEKVLKLVNEACVTKYKFDEKNVAILAPWADQGLGIQARSYYNTLKIMGFNVSIFSFKPYHASESNNFLQNNKKEWEYDNIYYSHNYRENIDYFEILDFLHKYKVKKLILIEATFEPIFKIMSLLKLFDIKIYLIINIECVKITEINYHIIFDKILCNNFNSYFIMNNLIQNKCNYLGFHLEHEYFQNFKKNLKHNKKLNFVCSGGLNSISRKNIDILFEIFLSLFSENNNFKNINFNILIQGIEIPNQLKEDHPQINKIIKNCSYIDNLKNISENDIYIHCGGQEGLGLGFYEALYLGLPILTIDWTPNNEIVKNNYNGWLVDCDIDKVYENNECLINRGIINRNNFKLKIIELVENIDNTNLIINNTISNKDYYIEKNKNKFEKNLSNFLSTIPSFY